MRNVLFTTSLPAPYQVELFDAIAASGKVNLTVLYCLRTHKGRSWEMPTPAHQYRILSELNVAAARDLVRDQDVVVFSGYHPARLRSLIGLRARSGQPWAFWGERPGANLPNWLGRHYRRVVLRPLGASSTPIWGIGSWAVDEYRREFGDHRKIINIPYFSRLDGFLAIDRPLAHTAPRRVLYSGQLIERKGVDLLMRAFLAIAGEFPQLELDLIGDGPMREQLMKMSAPIAERVHFHGFKQWAELPSYYGKADVLCAPSRYDGWGMIIPEGLASGLLIVSTNRTGAARDLVDSGCGWVVQADVLGPLIAGLRAAVSTSGPERIERIARGRSIAAGQDVVPGVARVLAAIEESRQAFKASDSGDPDMQADRLPTLGS